MRNSVQEIVEYLSANKNKSFSEKALLWEVFGRGTYDIGKKHKDMLRRGLAKGLYARKKVWGKRWTYEYFINDTGKDGRVSLRDALNHYLPKDIAARALKQTHNADKMYSTRPGLFTTIDHAFTWSRTFEGDQFWRLIANGHILIARELIKPKMTPTSPVKEVKTVEISVSKIKEAAKESADVKKVLKKLFPAVIETELEVKYFSPVSIYVDGVKSSGAVEKRSVGELEGKAFWLSPDFSWKIVKDEDGELCLVPTLKE